MDVTVIVVNYNTARVVLDCVRSALNQVSLTLEVIIVDNASTDGSQRALDTLRIHDNVQLLLNRDNVGFGRANNQAYRQSRGRYIFLLNPDAIFKSSTDLLAMVEFMDRSSQCGLAGTRILKNEAGNESKPFHFYPGEKFLRQKLPPMPGDIAWVLGASMIIRREVYEAIKGFDEDYFLYAEEADLCMRIRQLGFSIEQYREVAVRHIGGVSENTVPKEHVHRKKQAALYLFYKKHYPVDEIQRLVKKDRARALLRLLPLILPKVFSRLSEHQLQRYSKYKAVYETAKAFLRAQLDSRIKPDISVL
ncbi:MAG: hypothetical protein JWM78_352 [Verrucomicrobiaceae bacterium]|nr:hypothetical protein [Verrucomicrobiaceae bacterium]